MLREHALNLDAPALVAPPDHLMWEDYVIETSSYVSRFTRIALAGAMALTLAAGTASAQDDPNPGAITLTAGIDFPSVYFFRGIRQEADPSMTMFAFGDVGIALFSNDQRPERERELRRVEQPAHGHHRGPAQTRRSPAITKRTST